MAEINRAGKPDINTEGTLGDIWVDTSTDNKYKLACIINTTTYDGTYKTYEWVRIYEEIWTFYMVDGSTITKKVISE